MLAVMLALDAVALACGPDPPDTPMIGDCPECKHDSVSAGGASARDASTPEIDAAVPDVTFEVDFVDVGLLQPTVSDAIDMLPDVLHF